MDRRGEEGDRQFVRVNEGRSQAAAAITLLLHLVLIGILYEASHFTILRESAENLVSIPLIPFRHTDPEKRDLHARRSAAPANAPSRTSPHAEPPPAPPAADNPDKPLSSARATTTAAPDIATIIENSRDDLRKLDGEWRKQHRKPLEPPHDSVQSKLENGIAAAGAPIVYRTETTQTQDGRLVTKVFSSFGVMCYITRGGGDLDGRDAAGIRADSVKAVSCSK
jgi:hypothetical protein